MSKRKIVLIFLCCAMALLLGAQAMAEQVYVSKTAAVYAKPSTRGKKYGTLKAGAALELVAVKNGWALVSQGSAQGYMKASALVKVTPCDDIAAYTKSATPMLVSITASSGQLYVIPEGAALVVDGKVGSMARVRYNSATGFVKASALTREAPGTQDGQTQTPSSVTAYANRDGASVYNVKGKVIGGISLNTAVTVTATKGNVCRVTLNGVTVYMLKSDLSDALITVKTTEDNSAFTDLPNTTAYVNKDGAVVLDGSGKQIAALALNTAVTVNGSTDTVCRVVNNGAVGYIKKADLSASKTTTTEAEVTGLKYGDSGEAVKKLQTRLKELGYFSGTVGGNYSSITMGAVAAFQTAAKLNADGVADAATLKLLFSDSAPKSTASGSSTLTPAKGRAIEMDWWTSDIQKIFAKGVTAQITDVATGLSWREQRRGGSNHADVQPLTAADTAVLKKVYGGTWSWNRRAIFVTINGVNYAASMNGMPHGGGSITNNNFNGHHCIHFTNSRTHGSNKVCPLHQAAIKKAAAAVLK